MTDINTTPQVATVTKKPADLSVTIIRDTAEMAEGVRIEWADGAPALSLLAADLADALQYEAMCHGLKQKLGDAAAISRNPDTGRSATVADKRAAVEEVYQRLLSGKWNKGRAEGGMKDAREQELLIRAMARVTEKSVEDARTYMAARSADERTALALNPKVRAVVEELRAAALKVDPTIDSDALLAGLMG